MLYLFSSNEGPRAVWALPLTLAIPTIQYNTIQYNTIQYNTKSEPATRYKAHYNPNVNRTVWAGKHPAGWIGLDIGGGELVSAVLWPQQSSSVVAAAD